MVVSADEGPALGAMPEAAAVRRRLPLGEVRRALALAYRERYESSLTISEIAAETGRSYYAVRTLLVEAGTRFRPAVRRPDVVPRFQGRGGRWRC